MQQTVNWKIIYQVVIQLDMKLLNVVFFFPYFSLYM
jgi:hypothetical protein